MDIVSASLLLGLLLQEPSAAAPPPVERIVADVAYGDDAKQRLDLYLPAASGRPLVVFVYGGGWHAGSGKSCAPVAERLRAHGYGCVLVSHRLSPPDRWPAMIEDVAAAFAWTKAHAAEQGADPGRIFLAGHSSGAQLVLLLASEGRWLAAHQLSPADVAGVVALSTPVDLAPRPSGIGFGDALLGGHGADAFGRDIDVMRAASPIAHLSQDLPPTLLAVGDHDFPLLADDARAYAAKAHGLGLDVPVIVGVGKDHMAVVAALLDDEEPLARAVFEFLDAHAAPAQEDGHGR